MLYCNHHIYEGMSMYTLQNLLLLPLLALSALAQVSRTSPLVHKSIYHNHLQHISLLFYA